jgi:LCP family protein required for cell wall assembly
VTANDHDTDWLPPQRGGTAPRRRGRRLALVLVVALALPLIYGLLLALRANGSIERVEVDGLSPHLGGPLNTLIIGSDSRAGMTDEERAALSTGGEVGERTDTIIVLSVENGRAAMLSFPRDLWLTRCDGREQRINTAVQAGGLGCLARTIEDVSGIPVHHAVSVSFLGFVGVVDAVGGVELCLPSPIQDRDAGIDLPAGCQVLDGADALGYVRVRKIDNDLKRIERQQGFLKALAKEMASPTTLLNPVESWRMTGEVGDALTADAGLGPLDLTQLAWGGRGIATGHVVTTTVPTRSGRVGQAAVEFLAEGADEVFASFRTGEVLRRADADAVEVDRADVTVDVLNGAGVDGAASRTAEALGGIGYRIGDVANASSTNTTTIVHPAGQEAAAELLAADVEEAIGTRPQLEARDDIDHIVLILGRDLTG